MRYLVRRTIFGIPNGWFLVRADAAALEAAARRLAWQAEQVEVRRRAVTRTIRGEVLARSEPPRLAITGGSRES